MRVGLTYDLDAKTASCSTEVNAIAGALRNLGNDVVMIGSAPQLVDKLAAGDRYDLVFNCCRFSSTAAGQSEIATLLDIYDIACTFSPAATLHICNQRSTMKSLLRDRGIPTSDYWLVETLGDIPRVDATYPVAVGSAISCCALPQTTVGDASQLSKACCQVMSQGTPALIEPKLAGSPIVVAMIGNGAAAACLMPKTIDSAWSSSIQRTAQAAWRMVGGCDAGCITLHCDDRDQPHVLGIDPLPSLAMDGQLMTLAQAAGLTLDEVIGRIVQSAAQRAGVETLRPHLNRVAQLKTASTTA